MEDRTRFNLSNSLGNWKRNLSGNHSMTADNIEELESHLLDEIENLASKGLNEEEAFLIATKRMGTKNFLVAEFSKLNIFNTIVLKCMPFLQGILFYFGLVLMINILGKSAMFLNTHFNFNLGLTNTVFILIFVSILMITSYNIFNNIKKGKPALRLLNNIPFLILGVVLLRLGDVSLNVLLTRMMSMSDYGSSIYHVEIFKGYFTVIILIMTLAIYFKSRQIYKMKIA